MLFLWILIEEEEICYELRIFDIKKIWYKSIKS